MVSIWSVGLQYLRIQGFKEALITLVEAETDGTYVLSIGATDIQYLKRSFSLKDIILSKVDTSDSTGVLAVTVPQLTVTTGSLISMLVSEQFKIQELSITEPIARIGLKEKKPGADKGRKTGINMAHEIVRFYPAIESILSEFDIKLFHIDRAGIELDRSQMSIEIRLLDLLISDWNMRELSDEAEFRLSLGRQSVEFASTEFSFGSIVYDYHLDELEIIDYNFKQKDSLQRTVINIEGASMRVINLDYDALINDEHFVLEQLSINEPFISVHVYPHKKKKKKSKYPISDLLKRNLRELLIDEYNLKDGKLELNIYGETDTLYVHLPKINLDAKNIMVTEDSSTIMIGELNLELDKTLIGLGGPISLQFSRLTYDHRYNVEIDSIELLDNQTGKDLITCESLKLFNFDFFHFYYENDLTADSLMLQNGKLNIYHGAPRLKKLNQKKQNSAKRKEAPTLHIGKVKFDGIDMNIDLGQQQILIQNLKAEAENLIREDKTSYKLHYIESPAITYTDSIQAIKVDLEDVLIYPGLQQVGKLDGQYQDLTLSLDNLKAIPRNFDLDHPSFYQWNSIELASIELKGTLPEQEKIGDKNPLPDLFFQKVKLDQLHLDLNMTNNARLYATGSDFLMTNGQVVSGETQVGHIEMNIQEATYSSDQNSYSIGPAVINCDSMSVIESVIVKTRLGDTIKVDRIELGPWQKTFTETTMDQLLVVQLKYIPAGSTGKSTSDSIRLNNISWKVSASPYADQVNIYAPNIYISSTKSTNSPKNKGAGTFPWKMFGEINIDPGQINIDENKILFEQVHVNLKGNQKKINLKDLAFVTNKSRLHIHHIWNSDSVLNIDSVTIVPDSEYLKGIETERDVIAGQFYRIKIQEIDWDSLINSNKVVANRILLDGFDISIRRDKTLPDPERMTKPTLLSEMFPIIPGFNIPRITTHNGNISYHEVGEKTAQEGHITINDINITMNREKPITSAEEVLRGTAKLYNQGKMQVEYNRLDSGRFYLKIRLEDFPLEALNEMVDPLESTKIKSGYLSEYTFHIIADSAQAIGEALITYNDLHVEFFKRGTPDKKSFGSELLTILVDDIILKHSKTEAQAGFERERITYKGPINYWVKAAIKGAITAIRNGKSVKPGKR